ncbi:MAG: helix-turn-helix domain-containing protein [Candidatus Paceibacterota bacterium]|jgi:biotin operon repressor
MKERILLLLKSGNRIHAKEICKELNINERSLRRYKRQLQLEGYLIDSGKFGYQLVESLSKKNTQTRHAVSELHTFHKMQKQHTKNLMPQLGT